MPGLNDGLLIHLPFDGTANDASGNGHHGAVTGATLTADRHGSPNAAYYFNGASYITVEADDSVLNVNTNGWTLSLWMKPDATQTETAAPLISCGYGRNGGFNTAFWQAYGMFRTSFYDYSWSGIYVATDEWDDLIWHMYTVTYDGQVLKEYVNGILINQTTGAYFPTVPTDTYALRIGADSSSASKFFIGTIDDVRMYNRALSELDVAQLSGLSGAIRATKLNAYSLADFERAVLTPAKFSNFWAVWGNNGNAYSEVVGNPLKAGANTSDYVCVSHTFPSLPLPDTTDCDKSEYVLTTATGEGLVTDRHHIMKWKLLFTDDAILNIDIVWRWMSFNQIHQGAEKYPPPGQTGPEDDTIAEGGGIFNDCVPAPSDDPSLYRLRYRAIPDDASIPFHIDIGQWMSFTYEIVWTQSSNGYWRLWKDGELLSAADNVQTLPDSYVHPEDDFLQFKTGLYNKWNDPVIDRLSLYLDDLELYISEDIRVEDVSPECSVPERSPFLTCAIADGEASIIGCSQSAAGTLLIPASLDGRAVTGIDAHVFTNCTGLTGIIVPASVTNIGNAAFQQCSSLQHLVFSGHAPQIGADPFSGISPGLTIYHPEKAAGFSEFPWNSFTPTPVPPANPQECAPALNIRSNQTSVLTIAPTVPGRTYRVQTNATLSASWSTDDQAAPLYGERYAELIPLSY